MTFTHATAMFFWSALALPPVIASVAYFRTSPSTEPLAQRLAVSAHGIAISVLCLSALLIGGFGHSQQEFGVFFRSFCWVPVFLIAYSFWRFRGKKSIHLLQVVNLIWLFFAVVLGGMAVTGVWP